jgi:penicillin-insensitive murein endopeptidase
MAQSSRTSRPEQTARDDARHALRSRRGAHAVSARPVLLQSAEPVPPPWSKFREPTSALPQVIGGYHGGCIDGAVALPLTGEGFQVVHPERNRVFGHPDLIDMIRDLGARLSQLNLPTLAIGDLGQPRGGPTPSGHASHQTGLDVDIWFVPPWLGRPLSMVDAKRTVPSRLFDDEIVTVLELAASDPRVERLFINPVLKRAVCERSSGIDRAWLRKLRPWYGHDDHFHVRLACPADSPACIEQQPLPPGDGCDQLSAWLRHKPAPQRRRVQLASITRATQPAAAPKPSAPPDIPDGCRALLDPSPPGFSVSAVTTDFTPRADSITN